MTTWLSSLHHNEKLCTNDCLLFWAPMLGPCSIPAFECACFGYNCHTLLPIAGNLTPKLPKFAPWVYLSQKQMTVKTFRLGDVCSAHLHAWINEDSIFLAVNEARHNITGSVDIAVSLSELNKKLTIYNLRVDICDTHSGTLKSCIQSN